MPAYARKMLIPNGADCLVHTISRCVRRAWLCGEDPYSGKNFEHRREWVRERAKMLVNHFAVEVLAYAVMSNHSHFVLWLRPSVAAEWSAEEVARRWLGLFGKRVAGPTEKDIQQAVANAERVELWRGRLGDVSWFMRCLNEWLARKANAEDECTGRFWEGRFRCQLLEDEGALLACMAYVDLNPVRAKMATCLEESRLTSVHDRICAKRARLRLCAMAEGRAKGHAPRDLGEGKTEAEPTDAQTKLVEEAREEAGRDGWLCHFGDRMEEGFAPRDTRVKEFPPRDTVEGGTGVPTVLAIRFEDYLGLPEKVKNAKRPVSCCDQHAVRGGSGMGWVEQMHRGLPCPEARRDSGFRELGD